MPARSRTTPTKMGEQEPTALNQGKRTPASRSDRESHAGGGNQSQSRRGSAGGFKRRVGSRAHEGVERAAAPSWHLVGLAHHRPAPVLFVYLRSAGLKRTALKPDRRADAGPATRRCRRRSAQLSVVNVKEGDRCRPGADTEDQYQEQVPGRRNLAAAYTGSTDR